MTAVLIFVTVAVFQAAGFLSVSPVWFCGAIIVMIWIDFFKGANRGEKKV